jgi:hypothetical protein
LMSVGALIEGGVDVLRQSLGREHGVCHPGQTISGLAACERPSEPASGVPALEPAAYVGLGIQRRQAIGGD